MIGAVSAKLRTAAASVKRCGVIVKLAEHPSAKDWPSPGKLVMDGGLGVFEHGGELTSFSAIGAGCRLPDATAEHSTTCLTGRPRMAEIRHLDLPT